MAYRDLRAFIARLEAAGELMRVKAPVSAVLEISAIVDRVSKGPVEHNKALLFENVRGSDVPVLINAFGSARRMAWALGVEDLNELPIRLGSLLRLELPAGLGPTLDKAGELWAALRSVGLGPHLVRRAAVQEVVLTGDPSTSSLASSGQPAPAPPLGPGDGAGQGDATLDRFPILQCWPKDAGRYVTLPTVITRDPVRGTRNVGMYRLQVHDGRTLGMHWQIHKGGAEHQRVARRAGAERIPVAVSLGGDPAVIWCGSAPLPPDVDEFLLAGWLRGAPVPLVKCVSQPLEVPADAEIVIEGYVDPAESRPEGPFGDHTGYYTPVADYPVMHVTAITHRREPIYPATVVGRPPMEDYWMGKATERLFLPLIKLFLSEVVDVAMPPEGVFHNLVFVSIRKRFPGHPRKVINGLWGLGLLMVAKCIVVFDEDVDVQNTAEAYWQMFGNVDWARDVIIQEGPTDALDHASYRFAFGGKIGIDATAKGPLDGYTRGWPEPVAMPEVIRELVARRWGEYGFS
jgi:4-hydroxy-3-polyprenylbenzoate decarboxylase